MIFGSANGSAWIRLRGYVGEHIIYFQPSRQTHTHTHIQNTHTHFQTFSLTHKHILVATLSKYGVVRRLQEVALANSETKRRSSKELPGNRKTSTLVDLSSKSQVLILYFARFNKRIFVAKK